MSAVPRVVSIVGPGRSGTTLLGEILGEVPGVFDAGELRWLWRRGLGEDRRCGCGEHEFFGVSGRRFPRAACDTQVWTMVHRAREEKFF